MNSSRSYQPSAVLGVLLVTIAGSIGCQSMGKLNLLANKELPILTRDDDITYPPPSAAETPSPIVAATTNPAPATESLTTGSTSTGITYPPAGAALNPADEYPSTNYTAFPEQPEASATNATVAVPNAIPYLAHNTATSTTPSSPMTNSNVQQGMYATRSTPATTTAPHVGLASATSVDEPATLATSSIAGDWPTPLENGNLNRPSTPATVAGSYPTAQASHSAQLTSATSSSLIRDSEFGGIASGTSIAHGDPRPTQQPALINAPDANAPATSATMPTATSIATYIEPPSNGQTVVTASYESETSSHYDRSASSVPAGQGWRPGSTSTVR